MKTKYYLFGGQVAAPAYRWKGYTLPGLTRVASETRGLSGPDLFNADGLGHDPEVEYLPYRASGPEMLDPGEGGTLAGISDVLKMSVLGVPVVPLALAAGAAWFLFGKKRMRSNPSRKRVTRYKVRCWGPGEKRSSSPSAIKHNATIQQAKEFASHLRSQGWKTSIVKDRP